MSGRPPILLVGEAPNPATVGRPRLWLLPDRSGIPHTANRLLKFTGYSVESYLATFERTNLLDFCPPRSKSGGFTFPVKEGRERARLLADTAALMGQRIVVLGARAAQCFEWATLHHPARSIPRASVGLDIALEWQCVRTGILPPFVQAAIVPHPSGFNRWWNDEANRIRAHDFFTPLRAGTAA